MYSVKVRTIAFASFLMIAFPAFSAGGGGSSAGISMAILQWACLLTLLTFGYKLAWKPILANLDTRENKIKKSLEDAEAAEKVLEEVKETTQKVLKDAELEAKSIISKARETAQVIGKEIEEKAKSEAESVRDSALKDIESAKIEAMQTLRNESTELAIQLAGKLLGENLDTRKNRAFTTKLINKL